MSHEWGKFYRDHGIYRDKKAIIFNFFLWQYCCAALSMIQQHFGTPTILLVDDDEDTLILMQHTLDAGGFNSFVSPNAKDLPGILSRKHVDLILLDIQMGEMDGGLICRQLKQNPATANIPVVLFSANDNIGTVTRECGADAFLRKPFKTGQFQEIFSQLLT